MKSKPKRCYDWYVLKKLSKNWYVIGFLLFTFCLIIELFWLGAFYPATMNGDSINFWRMSALGSGYDNLQPILYTYLLFLLRRIWDSPAIVAILQILISSFLVTYFSMFLLKKGANKILVLLGYFAFVFSITVNISNTFVHKDSLYAQLILFMSIIIVGLFFKKEEETRSINFYLIGIILALIASIRYESVVYLLLIPFLMKYYKLATKRNLLITIITALTLFFCIQVPLPFLLKVKEYRYIQLYDVETQLMGVIFKQHGTNFSTADKSTLTTLSPLVNWDKLDPVWDGSYYSPTFKRALFADPNFASSWNKLFWKKIREYPVCYLSGRLQMAETLIAGGRINYPHIKSNELGLWQISAFDPSEYSGFLPDTFAKYNIRDFCLKLVNMTYYQNYAISFFLWSPFYLLVHLGFLTFALIKKKNYLIFYSVIALISFLAVMPMVTAAQFRYMYPLFYTSFFVPALYTIKAKVAINE